MASSRAPRSPDVFYSVALAARVEAAEARLMRTYGEASVALGHAGGDLAVVTEPGARSQANCQRHGFVPLYARLVLGLPD